MPFFDETVVGGKTKQVLYSLLKAQIGYKLSSQNNMAPRRHFVNTVTAIFNEDDIDFPISIFKVPNSLSSTKPEAYIPQLIGLGPFHHLKPEVQQMQMYKVVEAKRIHKGFQSIEFKKLVELLKQIAAPSVRASYNMYLEVTDDVLACIMAVDGLFLFGLLCCYGISKQALANSSLLSHLVDSTGRRLAQKTTLREVMMLENQIPILVLKTILIIECSRNNETIGSSSQIVSELFPEILMGFCQFVSPVNTLLDYPLYKALKHPHLLDFLYHLIILKHSPEKNPEEEEQELRLVRELSEKVRSAIEVPLISTYMRTGQVIEHVIDITKDLAPVGLKKPIELVQGLIGLPWSELGSSVLSAGTEQMPSEEILIPRASELHKAGVKFTISDHITTIMFDSKTRSFHLPLIKLNVNSEIIIRNLVAYEAMIKSETEPLILTRYIELMNGLIETSEDVEMLKDHGIIINLEPMDDKQVAKQFNGMSKSIQLTNTPDLDEAIEGVKSYYNGSWKVSACKFIQRWRRTTWKLCKVFSVVLILLLLVIQTFCSVYECPRFSFKRNTSQAQLGLRVPSLRSYV